MTEDLVQFLRDQLDDEESTARAAALQIAERAVAPAYAAEHVDRAGQWIVRPWLYSGRVEPRMGMSAAERVEIATVANDHIARHDPARVLREVEAKRGIVARYEFACREAAALNIGEEEREMRVRVGAAFQSCVLLLAAIYADRPGYREEWRA